MGKSDVVFEPETLAASEIPDVWDLRDRCAQILNILIPL